MSQVNIYNGDILNVLLVSRSSTPSLTNSIPIQPLTNASVGGSSPLYASALSGTIAQVTVSDTELSPSPAQIAAQIQALGLATAPNQVTQIGHESNIDTNTGNVHADLSLGTNQYLAGNTAGALVGSAGSTVAKDVAKTGAPLLNLKEVLAFNMPLRLFRSASLSAGTALIVLLMFALFDGLFFMTFFLENVHGLDPVAAGVHLLPLTAMLSIGSQISGKLINRVGPRIPIIAGMLMSAVALFGLSRLGTASSPNDTIAPFVVLGLGLSPVIVGATDVIVGNAPVQLAGVAGGLQSTAFQVGGTLGTAVLGAVMSAKVSALLPASWRAAHLPALTSAQLAAVKGAVVVGWRRWRRARRVSSRASSPASAT